MTRRSIVGWDRLIEHRATKLVRLHLQGRKPIPDRAKRAKLNRSRDRAMDLLIGAVEGRDREVDRVNAQVNGVQLFHASTKRLLSLRERTAKTLAKMMGSVYSAAFEADLAAINAELKRRGLP